MWKHGVIIPVAKIKNPKVLMSLDCYSHLFNDEKL